MKPNLQSQHTQLRVAIVHDYFREYGGAERVVEELHRMFPDAPVFTAFVDRDALGTQWKKFVDWDIRQSWAIHIPFFKKIYSPLRVLSAFFFQSFHLWSYDVVISSSNMYMAKAVRTRPGALHLCYCHTPPRSLYGYTTMTNWKKNPIVRIGGSMINFFMRMIDKQASKNPTLFIANSQEVQRRIMRFYGRESTVVYPPIHIPSTAPASSHRDSFLFVGRLAYSKHAELAVRACSESGLPLKVVGVGAELSHLQSIAGKTVEFLGFVSDQELSTLYNEAQAVLYPAEDEDFGMIAIEAMAYGTPVVVHRSGGFIESVIEGKTGEFIDELTVDAMKEAIGRIQKKKWNTNELYLHAKKFSAEEFWKKIYELVNCNNSAC